MAERDGYRDELAAAQARIAQLEDEVRVLRGAPTFGGAPDPRLAALEQKYKQLARAAKPEAIRRGATAAGSVPMVLLGCLGGLLLATGETGAGLLFLGLGVFLGGMFYALLRFATGKQTVLAAANAHAELMEARRLRAVERALAEARGLRIATPEEPGAAFESEALAPRRGAQ